MFRLRLAHWWMRTRTYRNIGGGFVGIPIETIAGIGGVIAYGIVEGLFLGLCAYMLYAAVGRTLVRTHLIEYQMEFEARLNPVFRRIESNTQK